MSANARAHIDAGLAVGLSLEQMRAEIDARLAQSRGESTIASPPTVVDSTVAWPEDHREDDRSSESQVHAEQGRKRKRSVREDEEVHGEDEHRAAVMHGEWRRRG